MSEEWGNFISEIPMSEMPIVRTVEGGLEIDIHLPLQQENAGAIFRLIVPADTALQLLRKLQKIDEETGMLSEAKPRPRTVQ